MPAMSTILYRYHGGIVMYLQVETSKYVLYAYLFQ